ncbi:hypothetical protein [Streptomyces luteireticuli]|uniref:hypothetical protein n=1 Tax=Streptomyces luteireticuli TaxID=173858 RepID=UPI00355790C3
MRVHRNRHDRAFVVVPNAAARHSQLSLAAVGLLVRLLSMPDGAKATIDSVTEQVEEGRRAVSKAFAALETAGYLRRERAQDPETGLWGTQTHISDLPMDRIPTVGAPKDRTVGALPQREKNQEKNLLRPEPVSGADGETLTQAVEEEGEIPQDKQSQGASDKTAVGRAAACLGKLGSTDRRLGLGTADVLRLAPLAAEWLTDGHSELKLLTVLTARLPEQVDAPAALISYRLKNHRPSKPKPKPAPAPRFFCQDCAAPFPAGVAATTCKQCASATAEPSSAGEPAPVSPEAAELLAAIRQRRATDTFTHGAKSRFRAAA